MPMIFMDTIKATERAGFKIAELKLIGGKVEAAYLPGRKPA
jgi:hypothetical protein